MGRISQQQSPKTFMQKGEYKFFQLKNKFRYSEIRKFSEQNEKFPKKRLKFAGLISAEWFFMQIASKNFQIYAEK